VVFSPPSQLVQQSVGAARQVWQTNSIAARQAQLWVSGTSHSASTSPPLEWTSATKQTPRGEFALFWRIEHSNTTGTVAAAAVGSFSLSMDVTVAANSKATTMVPLVGSTVEIIEGGTSLWKSGVYVPGVKGVVGAALVDGAVAVEHTSGTYHFVRSG
jgi:hypothetical protein